MLKGDTLLEGRYKIVKILGQGGMGAVYLAEDQRLPTTWAIKEMKRDGLTAEELRDAAELFRTEARLLSDLRHRNLPRIVDFFQQDVQLYLVMDFIEGETLEARILRDGPISLPFALDLCLQISDVLDYLHTRKEPVVFRDFKPGNVMLTPQNEVKLVDFGIARIFREDRNSDTKALGTPGYAAPEQYGKVQSGPRTDLYAFGATIHHALTGRDPTHEPFSFPPLTTFRQDLPPEFVALIESCLSMAPEGRPESAFAIKRELEQMLGHSPGSSSLLGRSTTTRLGAGVTDSPPLAVAPGTLPLTAAGTAPLSPAAMAPAATPVPTATPATAGGTVSGLGATAGAAVTFMPHALSFKNVAAGTRATARLRVKTATPITLTSNSPQLTVEPVSLQPGTSTVMVSLDSKGMAPGSVFKGAVEVQEVEEADLPVEASVAARTSTGVTVAAVMLAVGSLVPVFNYFCTAVLAVMCLSTPRAQRSGLKIPWRLSLFFSICYSGLFAVLAYAGTLVDWTHIWNRF